MDYSSKADLKKRFPPGLQKETSRKLVHAWHWCICHQLLLQKYTSRLPEHQMDSLSRFFSLHAEQKFKDLLLQFICEDCNFWRSIDLFTLEISKKYQSLSREFLCPGTLSYGFFISWPGILYSFLLMSLVLQVFGKVRQHVAQMIFPAPTYLRQFWYQDHLNALPLSLDLLTQNRRVLH